MTTLDQQLKAAAELAAKNTGLDPRFIASWWVSENGWTWPESNNVGNISYQGTGLPPDHGVFTGATKVNSNKTVDYSTMAEGVNAWTLLLETPKKDKLLTLDLADLKACKTDIKKMTELVGESNWAESHYNDGQGPGTLIWDVYNSTGMVDAFKDQPAPTPHPAVKAEPKGIIRPVHSVRQGETLSKIALDHKTSVRAIQYLNGIKDPDIINAGEILKLPLSYRVGPGDTVSKISKEYGTPVKIIADMNSINPDFIEVGWHLSV